MYDSNKLVLTKEEKDTWESNEYTKMKSLPKFCPFRKQTVYLTMIHGSRVEVPMNEATFTEEFFCPCMGNECALWSGWNSCSICK